MLWAVRACSTVSVYGFGKVSGAPTWYYDKHGVNDKDTYGGASEADGGVHGGAAGAATEEQYHDAEFETELLGQLEDARLVYLERADYRILWFA